MSYNRGNAPTYFRQNSNESTPSGLPIPPFDSNNRPSRNLPIGNSGSSRNGDGNGGGNLGNGRKNTVRGAVRGTIREQGSAGLPGSNFVPTRALTRGKTLTRPDRFVAPAPLINPNVVGKNQKGGAVSTKLVNGVPTLITREPFWDPWAFFVYAVTFWAPGWLLKSCTKLDDKAKQRAWKEKVALCMIIVVMGGSVAFLTIGLTRVLCPVTSVRGPATFTRLGTDGGFLGLNGWDFNITASTITSPNLQTLARQLSGQDISGLFDQSSQIPASCRGQTGRYATSNLCTTATSTNCAFGAPSPALFRQLGIANSTSQVGFDWDQAAKYKNFMVLDGIVLNMNSYMFANPNPIVGDAVDEAIRFILQKMVGTGGKDATRVFYNQPLLIGATGCLQERYRAGHIDKITPGCFASQLFLYFSLIIILAVVVTRLVMAFVFKWFLSGKLIREPKNLKRKVISPGVMPEGANVDVGNLTGAAPWTATPKIGRNGQLNSHNEKPSNVQSENGMISMASIGPELFCVCLVTCYSEGADGIRITLDSIAATDYSDARKLLFIVCDGIVTGGGEKETTPDIVIGMLEKDERFGEPIAMSYEAVAEGSKGNNMALVYAGHYTNVRGHRTPTIVVVKTGMEAEESEKKPGNRGKRDSQMILMNFFSRVTYNDRMSPLDYDLFRKIHSLMGVTPDFFEVCLMVDADTKVFPLSLTYMVRAMQNDNMIMGLCGETRIANKRQSWVTMIQVFEYFISHHMSKAFEAVFGGVTCLPGCFSLYRLKARKSNDGDWVPVLVSPSVISEYSQTSVTTLHQKNLLLLGEDRFLTTLLLRTFPNRKMMFVPQARCRTVVPDTFSVLLSQRRRWINSTVHNLMELVLVRDLCGTFCFSMQFVIFIDLVGTVVLPVAICLTYTLIINYIFNPPASFSDAIPLLLLGAVLGLPAILILMTTFKLVYVGWMLIYLIALPIWNFVLPVYAFIKFDDFSWGETRIVEGELKGSDHHSGTGGITAEVPLRRWEDWERSRLRKIKRDEKRLREMQKSFGSKGFHQNPSTIGDRDSTYQDSIADGSSFMSGLDEDRWGAHMGFYSEDGPTALPPPVGLYHVDEADSYEGEALGESEMNRVLSEGWNDELELPRSFSRGESSDGYRSRGNSYGPPILAPPMFYSHSNDSSQSNHSPKNPFSSSTSSFSDMNHSNSQQGFYAQESGSAVPLVNSEVSEDFPQNRRRSLGKTNLDTGSDLREIGGRTPSPTKERTNWNQ